MSCELALSLREILEKENKFGLIKYIFEYIHADVGERGKTKEMVREVVGLIKGNGFEPKIKPYSFAATVVADRYRKKFDIIFLIVKMIYYLSI